MRNLLLVSVCLFSSLLFSQSSSRLPHSYNPPPGFTNTPFKLMVLDHPAAGRFVCTVITEDLRLRQEVATHDSHLEVEDVRVFEAPATKEDLAKMDELLSNAEFQAAKPIIFERGMVIRARVITVITSDHHTRIFFDDDRGGMPKFLATFRKFTEATRKKGLPKVTGRPELICPIPVMSAVKMTHATE